MSTRIGTETPLVIAVCRRCGLIRSATIPDTTQERHIGLGGACPGEPQVQEPVGAASDRSA